MTEKLRKAAMQSDGRRRCDGCPFYLPDKDRCMSLDFFKVCTDIFVEGFRKGAAWKSKQLKRRKL